MLSAPAAPEKDLERIFDKFARIKSNNRPGGLGIGLAFCRLAIQAHAGRIWVESEEGKGSRFTFILPAGNE